MDDLLKKISERDLTPVDRLLFYYRALLHNSSTDPNDFFTYESSCMELIILIREMYSIEDLPELKQLSIPIITRDNDLITISPLIIPFYKWKELIKYELAQYKDEFQIIKNKIIGLVNDLKYRLKTEEVFEVNEADFILYHLRYNKDDSDFSSFFIDGDEGLNKVSDYTSFVQDIKLSDLDYPEYTNFEALWKKIQDLENKTSNSKLRLTFDSEYSRSDVLKFFSFFEKRTNKNLQAELFINQHSNLKIEPHKPSFESIDYSGEINDIIDFLKYLKEIEVLNPSKNSSRTIANIIYSFYRPGIKPETIRKKLDNPGSTLSKEIRQGLNYFKK